MCVSEKPPRIATRRRAASLAPAAAFPPQDVVREAAAHSEAFTAEASFGAGAGGAAEEPTGSATRLPLRELVFDPAVAVFFLLHVAALASVLHFRPFTLRDAALVVASYSARMFGAAPRRRPPFSRRAHLRTQASRPASTASCRTAPIRPRGWCRCGRALSQPTPTPRLSEPRMFPSVWAGLAGHKQPTEGPYLVVQSSPPPPPHSRHSCGRALAARAWLLVVPLWLVPAHQPALCAAAGRGARPHSPAGD
jgi:hypothetical protein